MEGENEKLNTLGFLNLTVIVLCIFVLGSLLIDTLFDLPSETSRLLDYFDYSICAFFFGEFLYRFYYAPHKLKFLKWGWIDLIASIPMVDFLRAGRVLRLIRILRVVKAFRSIRQFLKQLFKDKAYGTFTTVSVIAILLLIFSSILILEFEKDSASNIRTAEDALWWSYTTITSVGYGDKYPVTTAGRIVAIILMTGGVGLFGTFTAYVASWFVGDRKKWIN